MSNYFPLILAQEGESDGDAAPAAPNIVSDDSAPSAADVPNSAAAAEGSTSAPGTVPPNTEPAPQGGSPFFQLMPLVLVLIVFWVFVFGGQRKERKKRESMLSALSKNDRVKTIGGILGTVVEIRQDEVILKVDEASNTRMRFVRGAIQEVVTDDSKDD